MVGIETKDSKHRASVWLVVVVWQIQHHQLPTPPLYHMAFASLLFIFTISPQRKCLRRASLSSYNKSGQDTCERE